METRALRKEFSIGAGILGSRKILRAVDGVDLEIDRAESVGIVGESGCGKTTLGRLILRLIKPTGGTLLFEGEDITNLSGSKLKDFRKRVQIVFQSPFLSLNPTLKVYDTLAEPMLFHRIVDSKPAARKKVDELLGLVGLGSEFLDRYPHELSGGQMQRVAIARALSVESEFIVFDEPTSSLDVSAQAQILNLIASLRDKLHLTYMFISHNLAVVSGICGRVAVMYAGKVVELANADEFFPDPKHPYSQILVNSVLSAEDRAKKDRVMPTGEPPSPVNPPSGCRFHPRCPFAMPRCSEQVPTLARLSSTRRVACFLYPEVLAMSSTSQC